MLDGWAHSLPATGWRLVHGGYLAVAAFFVLSGFVLARSYGAANWNRGSLARYAMARFARIYPVYALSLLLVAPFIAADSLPLAGGPLFRDKSSLLANYVLLLQGWTGTVPVGWNTPAWTLSCEVFFYLCFPLAAVALRRCGRVGLGIAAAVAMLLPELLPRAGMPVDWKPLIHLSDFTMGIVAARVFAAIWPRMEGRGWWLYAPAGVLALGLVAGPKMLPGWMELNTPLRPVYAMLTIGLGLGGGIPARLLSAPLTVFLGGASYSLYILHVPLLWWYGRYGARVLGTLPHTAAGFLFVALAVAASGGVYRFFEEPMNRRLRSHFANPPSLQA